MSRTSGRCRRVQKVVVAAAAASVTLGASAAFAQTPVSWVGATATPLSYLDPANWSSGLTPTLAANEFLMINNGGIATIGGTDGAEGAYLNLGVEPTHSGHIVISGGTLTLGEM